MKNIRTLGCLLLLTVLAQAALANQIFRWKDEQGNVFIQNTIPPEFVKGGYEVIDELGNVVKTVAPELSLEEREAIQAAQINAEMEQARDQELMRTYRSPLDVDRAMETWLSRMDMEIRVKENRINIKEAEHDTLQSRAANQERIGETVDPSVIEKMRRIRQEVAEFSREIRGVELRKDEARAEFMIDRERMVGLWERRFNKRWVEPKLESEAN